MKHIKIFEEFDEFDPFGEEIIKSEVERDPSGDYFVALEAPTDINRFVNKITEDGFEVIRIDKELPQNIFVRAHRLLVRTLLVKNNGRLEELKNYPEIRFVKLPIVVKK